MSEVRGESVDCDSHAPADGTMDKNAMCAGVEVRRPEVLERSASGIAP